MQEITTETDEFPAPMPDAHLQDKDLIPPTPDNPPWNSGIAVVVWLASLILIVVLQGLFIAIYVAQNGKSMDEIQHYGQFLKHDAGANIAMIAAVIPAHLLTLLLCWFVITNFNKYSFKQTLGWRFDKFKIWYVFVITAIFLAIGAGLTTYFGQQENEFLRILNSSRYVAFLVAFLGTFTAPIVEEVVHRGIMYSAFQRTFNPTTAIILVTFLFILPHIPQYSGDFISISMICALSLVLTMIRAYTKNLLPCIALHFVFNGVQSLFLVLQPFLEKYAENPQTKAAIILYFVN